MTNLKYFLCGGTSINVAKRLLKGTHTPVNANAEYLALDSSDANDSEGLFEVERMPGNRDDLATGSGKNMMTNYHKAVPFVKEMTTKHGVGRFNIVMASTSGGTGAMLATLVVRELIQRNAPFVIVLITDKTSIKENQNMVNTLRSLVSQTTSNQLNKVIPFIAIENDPGRTRGQINEVVANNLNMLSIFLNEDNEEADFEDIKNALSYSEVTGVPATLSKIRFFNKEAAIEFNESRPPVSVVSLFSEIDLVVPRFQGSVYRATGVFNPVFGESLDELHMVLDHGEAIQELEEEIQALETQQASKQLNYNAVHNLDKGADDNGMCFD